MQKVSVALSASSSAIARIAEVAANRDRSLSWIVGERLDAALAGISTLSPEDAVAGGLTDKAKASGKPRTFFITANANEDLRIQGARLGVAPDRLMGWAVASE